MSTQLQSWAVGARRLVPPIFLEVKRAMLDWQWFRGEYATWNEARKHACGYDTLPILENVLRSTRQVKAGRAAYERDGVLFSEPSHDAELLACLLHVAASNAGKLRILDFGGSLGTTYWQARSFLPRLNSLRWCIVEQAHFVEAGRREFEDETLRFFCSIDEAEADGPADVVLASTLVQYLPDPHRWIDELVARSKPFVILQNLTLHRELPDYVSVQHVPPEIYPGSYPVWFLNRARFLHHFADSYRLLWKYDSAAVWSVAGKNFSSTGLFFGRSERLATP